MIQKSDFWIIKHPQQTRTALHLVCLNLLLFIVVTSLPQYKSIHHHFIFPILGVLYALEWSFFFAIGLSSRRDSFFYHVETAQSMLLFLMGFMSILGVIRHLTILTCFDRCSFKLATALFLSGTIFLIQGRKAGLPFWTPVRSQLAGLGSLVWGVYLALYGLNLNPWVLDIALVIFGLVFWLLRRNTARLMLSLTIFVLLLTRHSGAEKFVIVFSLTLILAVLWLAGLWKEPLFSVDKNTSIRGNRGLKILSWAVFLVGNGFIFRELALYPKNQYEREQILLRFAESRPLDPAAESSPLARNLHKHVWRLSQEIGDRSLIEKKGLLRAQAYLEKYFKQLGVQPILHSFQIDDGTEVSKRHWYTNIEVILGQVQPQDDGIWVVGAHYDTSIGTPGADDNASAVAVLLELARLLKERKIEKEIHLVAFSTEEPPAFGTRNMGSYQYVKKLKASGRRVEGAIILETLGCFSNRPGSQLYPPLMRFFYPDRGNFIALGSNFSSRALAKNIKTKWIQNGSFPLQTVVLPSVLSSLMLSDQLNFWKAGYPAVVLTDTAFYRNPHYHQATDTSETLDYNAMATITEMLGTILACI